MGESDGRGAELVEKLLGFSRSQKLALKAVSLADYLQEVIPTLRRVLPATIELAFEATEGGAVVEVDSGALQQMLLNLATNARDAIPNGGTPPIKQRRMSRGPAARPLPDPGRPAPDAWQPASGA